MVWAYNLDNIIPTCRDFEDKLIKLVWNQRSTLTSAVPSASASNSGSDVNLTEKPAPVGVDEKEVEAKAREKEQNSKREKDKKKKNKSYLLRPRHSFDFT